MFKSISRSIHKTPLANDKSNCYENVQIDHFLTQLFQSPLSSEGVFGIEQFIVDDYCEDFVFTPQIYKLNQPSIQKDWTYYTDEMKQSVMYEIKQHKQSFFPLDIKKPIHLLNKLKELNVGTLFIQCLLCKRVDNWRDVAIQQYDDYLLGNESPHTSKIYRNLQSKIIQSLRNFDLNRTNVIEIENKIASYGYRFELRIVLFDAKYKEKFENALLSILNQMNFYNELCLLETKYKKDLLQHIFERKFQFNMNQLLSEQEISCLLIDNTIQTTAEISESNRTKSIPLTDIFPSSKPKSISSNHYLQQAIEFMPYSENKTTDIDQSIVDTVNNAFKRVGVSKKAFKVTEMYQGTSLLKIQFTIPQDLTFTSIKKKLVDIQSALGNEQVTIEIGDKPDTINVFIPLEERDVLYFRNILESEEFEQFRFKSTLPIILGENVNGGYMFACLSELRHLLIAGATGSGKSVSVNLIIMSLILCVPPDELILYLIDPKIVEFTNFGGFPQVKDIITNMKKAVGLLSNLCEEMDKRYELFAQSSSKNIQVYNEKSKTKLPYIVTVIDELSDLMMTNREVEDYIVRLCQKARGAGIHLIIATQRPSVDVVTGLIKANLPSRISFSVSSHVDSKTILDKGGAEKLLGKGDALCKLEGQSKEFERFQAPMLTMNEHEEDDIYEMLKELFHDVESADSGIGEIIIEEPIDKLKRTIASTGELRVSELGRLMKIGNNAVNDLMKQLVDEEWLRREGRSYVINVSEDELNNYKDEVVS